MRSRIDSWTGIALISSGLSGDQVTALKFAAHRQLARWSNKPRLSPRQDRQRAALKSAVGVLQDQAFAHGCELRIPAAQGDGDVAWCCACWGR